jgi:hypothetical protein
MAARLVWGSSIRWPWYFVALAALGRVYTGDHYPTDVLASIPLSMGYTWLIAQFLDLAWKRKIGPKFFPNVFHRIKTLLSPK